MSIQADGYTLERTSFAKLEGWQDDDPAGLFGAMRACHAHVTGVKPYRTGSLGLSTADLLPLLQDAVAFRETDAASARAFFEERCVPFLIRRTE